MDSTTEIAPIDPVPTTALVPTRAAALTFDSLKALVLEGVNSSHTRRSYDASLTQFFAWYELEASGQGFTKPVVTRFVQHLKKKGLSASTINVRLAPVRRLAAEAADNGLLAPELAAGIARVKGAKQQGVRTGNWLTIAQAERLIQQPNPNKLKGKRDRALLAVLIGCGLRRSEASDVTFEHIQQRDGRWAIVDLLGKGGRLRTVPMPAWVKVKIDLWSAAAGLTGGHVFCPMNNRGQIVGEVLLPQNIMEAVVKYSRQIAADKVVPHDLRRTFARLAHKGHAAIEQIQLSLGHASIVTTERYLGVRQDLQDAPCDHLGLHVGSE
jgi:site-specific recombinase XerD